MSIDVRKWGHLGGVIPVIRRAANKSKWTNEQQRGLTRQLRYGCGKRREFHNHPSKTCAIPPETIPPSKSRSVLPRYLFSVLWDPWPAVSFSHKA